MKVPGFVIKQEILTSQIDTYNNDILDIILELLKLIGNKMIKVNLKFLLKILMVIVSYT